MPPRKKSKSQYIELISGHLATLSVEMEELRAKPTDETLLQRMKDHEKEVTSLAEFKLSLEDLCQRLQSEMDDLFSDNLWQSMLYRCTRYRDSYNDSDVVAQRSIEE